MTRVPPQLPGPPPDASGPAEPPCRVCGEEKACPACSFLSRRRWSPYLIGVGIGVLSWATFALMGKALGTSTTMVHLSGAATGCALPDYVASNAYYKTELGPRRPMFDWQFFLVLGTLGGAALAAWWARDLKAEHVPSLWARRFGPSRVKRYLWAFIGGIILIYGARMAGGCTSGHGISGGLQLALSSWTFFLAMFASGVATAFALFGMKGSRDAVEL